MRHEQALPTQQLANPTTAGTSAFVDVAFHQTHVKGDRETALAKLVVSKCCGKELIESFFYPMTEPSIKAQCGLNLSKVLN